MKLTLKIIGSIIFIGVTTLAIVMTVQYTSTKNELILTQEKLAEETSLLATRTQQLETAREELSQTQVELTSTQNELLQTTLELDETKSELATTERTLATTLTQLSSTQSTLSSTESTLSEVESELSAYKTTMEGMGITVYTQNEEWDFNNKNWEQDNNSEATDPTWAELVTFITTDTTDQHTYNLTSYNCVNYAVDVHSNAEAAGITAAVVTILWNKEPVGHAVNAFITSDYGLVFVDCTSVDKIAYVVKDKVFREVSIWNAVIGSYRDSTWWASLTSYYYVPSTYYGGSGETITKSIDIYW